MVAKEIPFARLFDLEDGAQVLLALRTQDDGEYLDFRTQILGGLDAQFSLGPIEYEKAIERLQQFTLQGVIEQRNKLIAALSPQVEQ